MKLIFKYFFQALKEHKKLFLISFFLIILVTALNTAMPYGLRIFIEYNVEADSVKTFSLGLLLFVAYFVVLTVVKILWNRALDAFGGKYIENLTVRIMKSLSRTTLSSVEEIGFANLKHVLYADILDVFRVVGNFIPNLIGNIVAVIASLALATFFGWGIALFILLATLIGFVISVSTRKIIAGAGKTENVKLKAVNAEADSFIRAIALVQSNNISEFYYGESAGSIRNFIKTAKTADSKIYACTGAVSGYYSLIDIVLSCLLAMPFSGGSVINLVFFTLLAGTIISQSQQAENYIFSTMRVKTCFENIDEVLAIPVRSGTKVITDINSVEFKNVSFSYGENAVFEHLNLQFEKGQKYLIKGENGGGKSTAMKLLLGLYNPAGGEVLINGGKVQDISQNSINENILYINQDEVFPNVEFKKYLRLINTEINEQTILEILNCVGLEPDGQIEDCGQNLSGGQRKKLLIAKLMARIDKSSLIIIDEICAGLDMETTDILKKYLSAEITENKTVISIEHNTKLFEKYDKIVEL